jgi:hypothetical protein
MCTLEETACAPAACRVTAAVKLAQASRAIYRLLAIIEKTISSLARRITVVATKSFDRNVERR